MDCGLDVRTRVLWTQRSSGPMGSICGERVTRSHRIARSMRSERLRAQVHAGTSSSRRLRRSLASLGPRRLPFLSFSLRRAIPSRPANPRFDVSDWLACHIMACGQPYRPSLEVSHAERAVAARASRRRNPSAGRGKCGRHINITSEVAYPGCIGETRDTGRF